MRNLSIIRKAAPIALCVFQCIFLFSFASNIHAGKIYQWVDENGKKHFTQTPPPDKKAEAVMNTGATAMKPQDKADGIYCGELQVAYKNRSRRSNDSDTYMATKISRWEESLKYAEDRLESHIQYANKTRTVRDGNSVLRNPQSYMEQKQRLTKSVNQYRCAIGWARNENNPSNVSSLQDKYSKAKEDYTTAVEQQQRICGEEPPGYNKYGKERDVYTAWEKCTRKYGAVVRRMKSKLRSAERAYSKTQ